MNSHSHGLDHFSSFMETCVPHANALTVLMHTWFTIDQFEGGVSIDTCIEWIAEKMVYRGNKYCKSNIVITLFCFLK